MLGALFALLMLSLQGVSSDKCYAMTMEGGGMCGAYEAGGLMALKQYPMFRDESPDNNKNQWLNACSGAC